MPTVASSEIGCVPDLVRDGRNGRRFPAGNIVALADALWPLLADAGLRERMGRASRAIISRWSYAECETGLRAALAALGVIVPGAVPDAVPDAVPGAGEISAAAAQ